ncbi:MAG TPA: hypothetical protein VLI05_01635 [Candidatus Saccharimonadia bacterium]|nr:hypothetical protein [Candidatus Saccharimonadia bacterium]
MNKSTLWIAATLGSIVGGWLPTLFGAGDFSGWSILGGTVGGVAAVIAVYRWLR